MGDSDDGIGWGFNGLNSWRAGCAVTRTSGSEGGPGKRTGGNTSTAPGADPYHRRAAYDLQWKVALGVELTAVPFGKSTLCEFRAALLLHQEQAAIFKKSLKLARQRGYLKQQKKLKVALDTTAIFGPGRGQGHVQPAGRRHRAGGASIGCPSW